MRLQLNKWTLFLAAFFLMTFACAAQAAEPYNGELNLKIEGKQYRISDLPKFEDYPPEEAANPKVAADIDWTSNKDARMFRTKLREGLKKGANFNGHYAVIMHGCGSSCQVNWIVDVNNGKVVDRVATSFGADYRLDSSLIAENLMDEASIQEYYGFAEMEQIVFSKVEKGKLIPVKTLMLTKEIESLKRKQAP